MVQQVINIGSAPNDGTGDPLRSAYTKINSNFTELYNNIKVIPYVIEPVQIEASGAGSTVNFYVHEHSIANYTSDATSNWTLNISFSASDTLDTQMTVGQGITCAFLAKQGATPYYADTIEIDGTTSGVTTYWQGGTAPSTGNASGVDIYSFTIIKTAAATFSVYASQTRFA